MSVQRFEGRLLRGSGREFRDSKCKFIGGCCFIGEDVLESADDAAWLWKTVDGQGIDLPFSENDGLDGLFLLR